MISTQTLQIRSKPLEVLRSLPAHSLNQFREGLFASVQSGSSRRHRVKLRTKVPKSNQPRLNFANAIRYMRRFRSRWNKADFLCALCDCCFQLINLCLPTIVEPSNDLLTKTVG